MDLSLEIILLTAATISSTLSVIFKNSNKPYLTYITLISIMMVFALSIVKSMKNADETKKGKELAELTNQIAENVRQKINSAIDSLKEVQEHSHRLLRLQDSINHASTAIA